MIPVVGAIANAVAHATGSASATCPSLPPASRRPSMANRKLQMTLNGQAVGPVEVAEDLPMIDYLHEYQNLTGSRLGCGQASAMPAW